MSTDFCPPVDTHPSGDNRHVNLGRAAEGSPPAGGSNTGRRRFGRSWLDTTAWWTEPRPAISALVEDAKTGEWTLRSWQRHGRWCWLQTAARSGRVWPWLVARQVAEQPPALWGELPPVRGIAETAELHWGARLAWLTTSWLSWVADSFTRTALLGVGLWFNMNYINNLPVLHWLVPDVVTAAYWWPGFVDLVQVVAPLLAGIAVLGAVGVVAVWQSRRSWRRRREEAARGADLPVPTRHQGRRPARHGGGSYVDDDLLDSEDWGDDSNEEGDG